jgi:hypothetical protein
MPKHVYIPLDEAAFERLEAAGSSKLPNGAKIKFTADAKDRLNTAIARCERCRELSEAWSPETQLVTSALVTRGLKADLVRRILEKPVRLYFLLYEEGTAELKFPEPGATDPNRQIEEVARLLADFANGTPLPEFINQLLVTGAKRRRAELGSKIRKHETNTHMGPFCLDAVRALQDSGGNAKIGSKLRANYLKQLFDEIPVTIQPSSKDALVLQAKRALFDEQRRSSTERPKGGARGPRARTKAEVAEVSAAGGQPESDTCLEAISAASSKHSANATRTRCQDGDAASLFGAAYRPPTDRKTGRAKTVPG